MNVNKYLYLHVVQGNYGQGWEDETAEETRKEARARLREYRENMPEYPHRIISRREINPNYLRIRKISGSACETRYQVDGVGVIRYWIIVSGIPALDYDGYSAFTRRFPNLPQYAQSEWDSPAGKYRWQKPGDSPDALSEIGRAAIVQWLQDTYKPQQLSERRYAGLPAHRIVSKRLHNKPQHTYVRIEFGAHPCYIPRLTFNSTWAAGPVGRREFVLMSPAWRRLDRVLYTAQSNSDLWSDLSEDHYQAICNALQAAIKESSYVYIK